MKLILEKNGKKVNHKIFDSMITYYFHNGGFSFNFSNQNIDLIAIELNDHIVDTIAIGHFNDRKTSNGLSTHYVYREYICQIYITFY